MVLSAAQYVKKAVAMARGGGNRVGVRTQGREQMRGHVVRVTSSRYCMKAVRLGAKYLRCSNKQEYVIMLNGETTFQAEPNHFDMGKELHDNYIRSRFLFFSYLIRIMK